MQRTGGKTTTTHDDKRSNVIIIRARTVCDSRTVYIYIRFRRFPFFFFFSFDKKSTLLYTHTQRYPRVCVYNVRDQCTLNRIISKPLFIHTYWRSCARVTTTTTMLYIYRAQSRGRVCNNYYRQVFKKKKFFFYNKRSSSRIPMRARVCIVAATR